MGDIQLALRSLLKSKLFTTVAVTTLTVGIGASTAVFSLYSATAIRPLPFPGQEQLVDIEEWSASELCSGCSVGVSLSTLQDLKSAKSIQAFASHLELPMNVGGETPERVSGALVSGNFFSVLGVNATIGRALDPSDDRPGAPMVVVISSRLFARRFGGDQSVVGQPIRLNGSPHILVGVMPSTAVLPEFAELWTPIQQSYHVTDRGSRELGVIGRLRPGASVEAADREAKTIAAAVAADHPDTQKGWTARVRPLRAVLGSDEASLFAIMLGGVLVLLLIVCANLASLMLARGATRRKDIAVRLALGAKQQSIVWHLLAESLCLSIAGGVLGVVAASWAVDVMVASLQTAVPAWLVPEMDYRVILFSVTVSIGAAIAFGLVPALRASRADLHEDIKAGAPANVGRRRSTLRGSLVVLQMALSLILLAAAGVLAVTVRRISAPEIGVSDSDVLQARIEMLDGRTPEQEVTTVETIVQRLSSTSGVRAAAAQATGFVAGFGAHDQSIRAEGVTDVPQGASPRFYFAVTPKYFETVGLQLLAGRRLTDADRRGTVPVVVINREMARRLWPGLDPIGRRLRLGASDSLPWRTVVGVVSDIVNPAARGITHYAYVPFAQAPQASVRLLVAGRGGDPTQLIKPFRETARSVDPDLPLLDLMTVAQDHSRTNRPYLAYAMMMVIIGATALLLAGIGLYGIVAFAAEQRTREVGLRIALGAKRVDVLRLITRQGLLLVGIGVVFGIAGAFAVLPVMKSILFGASPFNPMVFAGAVMVLIFVALIASYIPARRATRVDPMIAMKSE